MTLGIAGIKRIPNAKVVPYTKLLNNDGTMKPYPIIKTRECFNSVPRFFV